MKAKITGLLGAVLCLALCISLLPVPAFADAASYTVTFNPGSRGVGVMKPVTVTAGTEYTLPKCEFRSGIFVFSAWSVPGVGYLQPGDRFYVTDNVTVTAVWKAATIMSFCRISFISGGNVLGTESVSHSGTEDKEYTLPGYTYSLPENQMFKGWSCSEGSADVQDVVVITPETDTLNVYAVFEDCATITYEANGGTGTMDEEQISLGANNYTFPECTITAPEGKIYSHWTVPCSVIEYQPGDKLTIGKEHVTVTPVWVDCATITFDANGGTGTMPGTTVASDKDFIIPSCGFTPPEGKTFSHWVLEDDPSGTIYRITDTLQSPIGTFKFIAVWKDLPKIISGANGSWTQESGKTLSFTSSADFAGFDCVKVDGSVIDSANYTAASGSTIVTLNAEYLETLSVGKHTLGVVSMDGEATTTFTIKAKSTTPQTGDDSLTALWALLMLAGASGITVAAMCGKKKRNF